LLVFSASACGDDIASVFIESSPFFPPVPLSPHKQLLTTVPA